jgi:hypothetical protein
MLADADEVNPELVCEDSLIHSIPNDLRLWQQGSIVVRGHVAKGVESQLELAHHTSEPAEPAADSPESGRAGLDFLGDFHRDGEEGP